MTQLNYYFFILFFNFCGFVTIIFIRGHGMSGDLVMLSVAPEPDHVTVNAFVALLVVQAVTKTCPKKKSVKVTTI